MIGGWALLSEGGQKRVTPVQCFFTTEIYSSIKSENTQCLKISTE